MKRAAVSEFKVRSRQTGGVDGLLYAVYDGRDHFRVAVRTPEDAKRWIAEQAKSRSWPDVAGSHAAHVVGMGEL